MKRPDKEDYHQDRTGQSLMNGPYNQTAYANDLDKYIDHLESKPQAPPSGSEEALYPASFIEWVGENYHKAHAVWLPRFKDQTHRDNWKTTIQLYEIWKNKP